LVDKPGENLNQLLQIAETITLRLFFKVKNLLITM